MAVMSAGAQWYFSKSNGGSKKADLGSDPVKKGFFRVCKYHLGTVAFGSLLVTIVRFIRKVFQMAQKHLHEDNKFLKCCWYCINYCLKCFEKTVEFLSEQAYICVV